MRRMPCKSVRPYACCNQRPNGPRLAILAALAAGSLRQRCTPADAFSVGAQTVPATPRLLARTAGRLVLRRAAPDIPLEELAPDALADKTLQVLPRLPPWADMIVGGFLTVFPVVVIISWVMLNVTSYENSKKAKERDERRKIRKAIKTDDNMPDPDEMQERPRRRRRRKLTAFEESIALEEAASEGKPSSMY
mmetsp:Transcript_26076/g.52677  ORF Transcript_26076/g.52677 Transcript_26076/m.52677 type:complete len:193 (-) Transcript_26076:116-694(-)